MVREAHVDVGNDGVGCGWGAARGFHQLKGYSSSTELPEVGVQMRTRVTFQNCIHVIFEQANQGNEASYLNVDGISSLLGRFCRKMLGGSLK